MRSEVQRTVLEHHGRYGYRRITAELRRQGMPVNHKRVARLLREDNLVVVNCSGTTVIQLIRRARARFT